jgi:hypothetical protein
VVMFVEMNSGRKTAAEARLIAKCRKVSLFG